MPASETAGRPARVFVSVKNSRQGAGGRGRRACSCELGLHSSIATRGTAAALAAANRSRDAGEQGGGRAYRTSSTCCKNDEIALVINTVEEKRSAIQDSYAIRRAALTDQVPTYTTLAGARAAAIGLAGGRAMVPYSIQALHERLREPGVS